MPSSTSPSTRLARRARLAAVLLTVACTLVTTVPVGHAAATESPGSPPTTAADRQQLEEDLAEATADELRLGQELAAAEAERARLVGLLADVEARLAAAVQALRDGEAELGRATAAFGVAQTRLAASETALAKAVAELQEQAVESFIVGGRSDPIGTLLSPADLRELGAAATYRDVLVEHQDGVVARVTRLRRNRELAAGRAAVAKDAASRALTAAEAQRAVVDGERARLRELEAANAAAVTTHTGLLAEVQARKAKYEAELAALLQVSSSLSNALATRQAGQVARAADQDTFVLPVTSGRLSSRFGPRVHPIFGTSRLHAGMDLAAPTGTPVGAAGVGTVVTATVLGGYGNAVVVDHGGGLSTLYAHLSAIHVEVGDVVAPAEVIGLVGSTGNSTGPHLHFEVRVFGTPVDPAGYL